MLSVLTTEQLIQWMAFLDLEPTAADRDDIRQALHTAKILNAWLPMGGTPHTIRDLIIDWETVGERKPEPSPEEREQAIQAAILSRWG